MKCHFEWNHLPSKPCIVFDEANCQTDNIKLCPVISEEWDLLCKEWFCEEEAELSSASHVSGLSALSIARIVVLVLIVIVAIALIGLFIWRYKKKKIQYEILDDGISNLGFGERNESLENCQQALEFENCEQATAQWGGEIVVVVEKEKE